MSKQVRINKANYVPTTSQLQLPTHITVAEIKKLLKSKFIASGFEPGSPGEMTDDLRHYATLGPAPGKIAELDSMVVACMMT